MGLSKKNNSDIAVEFFRQNYSDFLEELKSVIRIKSISAPGFDRTEVNNCANAVAHSLREIGMDNVELLELPNVHPYVFGEWLGKKDAPTVLLYAHYDVQPTGDTKRWNTDPFSPETIENRLYGRGSADDKAGVYAHISALACYLKTSNELPLNVKVVFEGEEETGSEHLTQFLEKYKDRLAADFMILTDTENYDIGIPGITTRLRGLVSVDVVVSVLKQPVHSGGFGGPLPDAIQSLAKIIAKLTDDNGKMLIPGIYDDVEKISNETKDQIKKLPFNEEDFKRKSCVLDGVALTGEKDFSPHEQIWFRPSLSVNAIQASSREQVSNIIVDSAWCRLGIRTVPNMDSHKVLKQLSEFIYKHTPKGVLTEVIPEHAVSWWRTETKNKAFRAAKEAMLKSFGHEAVFMGCGGSIGFVEPFSNALGGAPALLIGVEDPFTNAHSWNESLYLPDWRKCIESLIYLYENLSLIKD